jgi:RNA polymerase sigma-70 factor (ECF subfamily)
MTVRAVATSQVVSPFEDAYRSHYARAVALAAHACGSRPVAEDLVQEVFMSLHQALRDEVIDNVGGWVTRAVARRCLNERRRLGRERSALARIRPSAAYTDSFDFLDRPALAAVLRRLSLQQRLVLILVEGADMSVADAAGVMGCAASTARVHLHRARTIAKAVTDSAGPRG